MALRREELVCAEALSHHLSTVGAITSSWREVKPDPPDVRFDVTWPDGSKEAWAVEITGLFQRFGYKGRKGGGSRYEFESPMADIVDRLNRELGANMQHGYWLVVSGPLDPKVFANLQLTPFSEHC
ncbi:MAG TPA: hypothetical protein VGE93_20765 [Bryobacteraceae bacterium]